MDQVSGETISMASVSTIPFDVLQSSGAAVAATEACVYESDEEQVVFQYPRTAESFEQADTIITTTAENAWWASIQFELPPPSTILQGQCVHRVGGGGSLG